eukprot:TRINITY_DN5894_c1_g3_i1.p1 TRINITY_DN5894_c1_g3~~TRINITY_DN5894_c1_g3_i1.p1  ORF type:complete len:584 (+),score=69.90 TRINITY_DN5894_c1_g3_i1:60-1811(+)
MAAPASSASFVDAVDMEAPMEAEPQTAGSVCDSASAASLAPERPCGSRWWKRQLQNRRTRTMLVVAGCVGLVSFLIYWTVPQMIIDQRLEQAVVRIDECVLEIGPDAVSEMTPKLAFSVSKDVLHLPLISFTARMNGFKANLFFHMDADESGAAGQQKLLLGTFDSSQAVNVDSSHDLNVALEGKMRITETNALSKTVNAFLKKPNVTVSAEAKQSFVAYVWGWLPFPFFGISVKKALTIQAFDNFRVQPLQLDELLYAHGNPHGELNVTASALMFNPSPVTMVLKDFVHMHVFYPYKQKLVKLGMLNVVPPLVVAPGKNIPRAIVTIEKDSRNDPALQAAIAAYIGPQQGFSPAGTGRPLAITISDAGDETSPSTLIRDATKGLSAKFDFRPKQIFFLSDITADVSATVKPPFYSCVVHVRIKNPVPQNVRVKRVQLVATHQTLKGPVLYHFDHKIQQPEYDPNRYVMHPFQNMTLDFTLNVLSEVNWGFLLSPKEIFELLREAASMKVVVGVSLNLTIAIDDGYEQLVPYDNNQLTGILCFHVTKPKKNCGGLPNMPGAGLLHKPQRDVYSTVGSPVIVPA